MLLFLIGLPGSGKSTLGKELAARLGIPFLDTDELIVKNESRTIEDIFAQSGESYFRLKEKETLASLINQGSAIVSTGGGLPCFFDNMDVINKSGTSIFLEVELETLANRLKNHADQNRPMIRNKTQEELLDFLKTKSKERYPFYNRAKIHLKGNNITPEEVIKKITS